MSPMRNIPGAGSPLADGSRGGVPVGGNYGTLSVCTRATQRTRTVPVPVPPEYPACGPPLRHPSRAPRRSTPWQSQSSPPAPWSAPKIHHTRIYAPNSDPRAHTHRDSRPKRDSRLQFERIMATQINAVTAGRAGPGALTPSCKTDDVTGPRAASRPQRATVIPFPHQVRLGFASVDALATLI